ncbi:hypothetical protein ACIRPQ_28915 [Streptomyces sp. NPDC101213]|uniref:hypothetical protein n=1 Tax=Streptomyces sp. NPDC101213 TaxID=3366130 RepID=UPI00382E8D84
MSAEQDGQAAEVAAEPVQRVRERWVSGWSSWRCFWSYQGPGTYLTMDPNGEPFRLVKSRREGWRLNGEPVPGVVLAADAIGKATGMIRARYVPRPKREKGRKTRQ